MTKGRAKTNSNDPPQPRGLGSSKRKCPSEKTSSADDVVCQQDTVDVSTAVLGTPTQGPQSPRQDCAMISVQQDQAPEQTFITKRDTTEENHVNVCDLTVKAFEAQEEKTIGNPNTEFQLDGFRVHSESDANKGKEKEEEVARNYNKPASQTCTDPPQTFLPISEEGDGIKATALKEQLSTEDNPDHKMETNHEESNSVCMDETKEITKEAVVVGLPAKKKRRMGMCRLTEKERSQFLQMQNRTNGTERDERQICNNTADLVAETEDISLPNAPSSPQHSPATTDVTERSEAEIKPHSSDSGDDNRAETDVTNTACDPRCSEAKNPRASDPEQTPELHPHAEEKEKMNNEEQQEAVGVCEIPEKQTKRMENVSADVDHIPASTFHTNTNQAEETVKENQDAVEASPVQVHIVTGDVEDDSGPKVDASLTDIWTESESCGSVEICKAPVPPRGSERKSSCGPGDEPGVSPCPVSTEPRQIRDAGELFGSGGLDYVSDSQLNTIVMTEEVTVDREEDVDVYEDGTDLIRGLIRELSSLNQTVMATHRELENLHRKDKNSRSSIH